MCISLNKEDYSIKNVLFWGVFNEHCKKANIGNLGQRVVHILMAGLEALPIISQIVSIFEKLIVENFIQPVEDVQPKSEKIETFDIDKLKTDIANATKDNHEDDSSVEKIVAKALTRPVIKALYDKATRTPSPCHASGTPWTISFAKDPMIIEKCDIYSREIKLSNQGEEDTILINYLVLALTKACFSEEFGSLTKDARSGKIDCETYCKEKARIGYECEMLYDQVKRQDMQERYGGKVLDRPPIISEDFKGYWERVKYHLFTHQDRARYEQWKARRLALQILVGGVGLAVGCSIAPKLASLV